MKTSLNYAPLILLIQLVAPALHAQVRCDLVLESCMDYNQSTPVEIVVPVNTTSIAREPLSVCLADSIEKTGEYEIIGNYMFLADIEEQYETLVRAQ